jgi:hypothetical protein
MQQGNDAKCEDFFRGASQAREMPGFRVYAAPLYRHRRG